MSFPKLVPECFNRGSFIGNPVSKLDILGSPITVLGDDRYKKDIIQCQRTEIKRYRMYAKTEHTKYMRMALQLALKGKGKVEPNPMVGAVVVKNGRVVGKGYHAYFGGPHAEINALNRAGKDAAGSTLYVTLEPCSGWGKTPPCVTRIIKSRVNTVVSAMADVNPKNRARGLRILRKNGVKVINDVLLNSACKMNHSYINSFKNKLHVIVKAAISLDGKIAGSSGDSKWITSKRSRALVHRLRSEVDAVVVGLGTVLKDDPELTSHGHGPNPIRVVIDPALETPPKSRVLDNKARTVIMYSKAPVSRVKRLASKAILLRVRSDRNRFDFKDIVKTLSDISARKLLIEGGGETIASALKSGVVDEFYVFIAPKIIGGSQSKTFVEGTGAGFIRDSMQLRDLNVSKIGPDLLIRAKGTKHVHRDN